MNAPAKIKVVFFPFNGNAIEALDALDFEKYDFLGFIEDNPVEKVSDWPLLKRDLLTQFPEVKVLAVPGSPISFLKRQEIIGSLQLDERRFISVIHPNAQIGRNVKIGFNSLILAGSVITSNAIVGNHVCVLPNTVIHHDSIVEDYCLIGSNAVIAGGTKIGRNCYLGSGTTIINGISIAPFNLIGIGSNIVKSIKEQGGTWVGNPARKLK